MDRAPFDIGEPVVDRDSEDDDPNTAIIVNCPPQTANDWTAYHETTVAEDNPDYPEDAPIAVAVYRDELAKFDPDWPERDEPFPLAEISEAGVSHYSFPASRLKSLETEVPDDTESETSENAEDTTDTEETSEDESETAGTNDKSGREDEEASAADDESDPEPPAAVRDLKETLADRGMTVEIEDDNQTIRAEKLGERYRLQSGEVLDGDGRYREKLEEIVAEA